MSPEASQAAPPAGDGAALRQLIMGFRTTQMIYVAAKLGIADHLREGPQTADALALAVGAAPRPLYRLLRALASIGIFAETPEGAFEITQSARLLQSNVAGSLRTTALLYGDDLFWATYGRMLHSVRTGEPADHVHGDRCSRISKESGRRVLVSSGDERLLGSGRWPLSWRRMTFRLCQRRRYRRRPGSARRGAARGKSGDARDDPRSRTCRRRCAAPLG